MFQDSRWLPDRAVQCARATMAPVGPVTDRPPRRAWTHVLEAAPIDATTNTAMNRVQQPSRLRLRSCRRALQTIQTTSASALAAIPTEHSFHAADHWDPEREHGTKMAARLPSAAADR